MDAPEQVRFTLDLADLGSRTYAYVVDLLIRTLLFLFCLLFVVLLPLFQVDVLSLDVLGKVLLGLALFGLQFAYLIAFEVLWNGQTPGKRFVGLRVVRDGGYPVGVLTVAIRNLLRIVDAFPFCYGIGAPLVFLTKRRKRIGDWVAGTIVVKETNYDLAAYERRLRAAGPGDPLAAPAPEWAALLASLVPDPEGLELVVGFLGRRATLLPANRIRLRWKILEAILRRQADPPAIDATRAAVPPNQIEPLLEAIRDRWT